MTTRLDITRTLKLLNKVAKQHGFKSLADFNRKLARLKESDKGRPDHG